MNLAIFLKAPETGKVKTRLCPPLREDEVVQLYSAFVEDLLDSASRTRCRSLWLLYDGDAPSSYLPNELMERLNRPPGRLRQLSQGRGDLGARLQTAVADLKERGAMPVLFVGSDHPDLSTLAIDHLLVALPSADLVLGEASDGGAWGIGVSSVHASLFAEIPWSTPNTAQALVKRAEELGLRSRLLSPWHDVDGVEELRALWQRLRQGESQAPRTRAWLESWTRCEEVLGELE